MKRHLFTLIIASLYAIGTQAQALDQNVEERLTQFFSNYKTNTNDLISTFFSPANLKLSLGLDYKQNKNKYNLSILGNPLSWRYVYLANTIV